MDKLVLFDVDRTLVKFAESHKNSFSNVFKKVYGVDTTIDVVDHHGMTDQQVIIEVLKKKGLNEKLVRLKMNDSMKVLTKAFEKNSKKEEIIVLNGVKKLLSELEKRKVSLGLVTGNIESVARIKLKKAGLNGYFKFGGFGNDAIDRTDMIKIAIKTAEKKFDFRRDNNVFFVCDNLRELKSGKKAGVKVISVATGLYSTKELKSAGADFVLEDLSDVNNFLKIIES